MTPTVAHITVANLRARRASYSREQMLE